MTSNDWNAAIDAALSKVREQRAVFSSDAYATPQPLGGFMERFACNSIEVEIEALRKTDTPPTPAADEREAVAVAALINALKQAGGYPATISHLKSGKFSDSISVRIAIAAIMDASAAEILAAEANERARIATFIWDNYSLDGCECDHGIRPPTDCPNENCNVRTAWAIHHSIERNEHGAGK